MADLIVCEKLSYYTHLYGIGNINIASTVVIEYPGRRQYVHW